MSGFDVHIPRPQLLRSEVGMRDSGFRMRRVSFKMFWRALIIHAIVSVVLVTLVLQTQSPESLLTGGDEAAGIRSVIRVLLFPGWLFLTASNQAVFPLWLEIATLASSSGFWALIVTIASAAVRRRNETAG